ncbi:MAG: hypothetical protein HN507_05245 [Flavobacteriaceae bacterium]|jgi:hypothetical protein|nr:hypothetical protein [Flavobacteriaceae bacterium]
MNFNYSYKAFAITILLLGGLYLLFYFVKLSSNYIVPEEEFEIEYAIEELILDENMAEVTKGKIKIETHQVYNEAEEFIKESEANRKENSEAIEDKLSEINDVISNSKSERISISSEKKIEKKKDTKSINLESTLATTNNSKSTNSYHLINRKVIEFPNPVYICESFGKVVLQIEVNANGYVIMTSVNKNTSTTTNLCLMESAIDYAKKARFTKDKNKLSQMGSITYVFPGQE